MYRATGKRWRAQFETKFYHSKSLSTDIDSVSIMLSKQLNLIL